MFTQRWSNTSTAGMPPSLRRGFQSSVSVGPRAMMASRSSVVFYNYTQLLQSARENRWHLKQFQSTSGLQLPPVEWEEAPCPGVTKLYSGSYTRIPGTRLLLNSYLSGRLRLIHMDNFMSCEVPLTGMTPIETMSAPEIQVTRIPVYELARVTSFEGATVRGPFGAASPPLQPHPDLEAWAQNPADNIIEWRTVAVAITTCDGIDCSGKHCACSSHLPVLHLLALFSGQWHWRPSYSHCRFNTTHSLLPLLRPSWVGCAGCRVPGWNAAAGGPAGVPGRRRTMQQRQRFHGRPR